MMKKIIFLIALLFLIAPISAVYNNSAVAMSITNITTNSARLEWNSSIMIDNILLNQQNLSRNNTFGYYQLSELEPDSEYSILLQNNTTYYEMTFRTAPKTLDKLINIFEHYLFLLIGLGFAVLSLIFGRAWILTLIGASIGSLGFYLFGMIPLYWAHWDLVFYGGGMVVLWLILVIELAGK